MSTQVPPRTEQSGSDIAPRTSSRSIWSASAQIAWRVALAASVGGFLLGFLDFVWIKFMPFPLRGLGNSSAVWAVAAFLFAYLIRRGWLAGTLGSAVFLVLAVPSYYLAATLIQGDAPSALWDLRWTAFGILAGVVFGAAGTAARRPDRWQIPALAAPAAVLIAEAALLAARLGDPSYDTAESLGQAVIEVGLGIVLVMLTRATWRRRVTALVIAAPFAALGFGAFQVAGFA